MSNELKVIKTVKVFERNILSKGIVDFLLQVYGKREIVFTINEHFTATYDSKMFSGYFKKEFGCIENEKILILL